MMNILPVAFPARTASMMEKKKSPRPCVSLHWNASSVNMPVKSSFKEPEPPCVHCDVRYLPEYIEQLSEREPAKAKELEAQAKKFTQKPTQGEVHPQFVPIQALLNLRTSRPADGGIQVLPASHQVIAAYCQSLAERKVKPGPQSTRVKLDASVRSLFVSPSRLPENWNADDLADPLPDLNVKPYESDAEHGDKRTKFFQKREKTVSTATEAAGDANTTSTTSPKGTGTKRASPFEGSARSTGWLARAEQVARELAGGAPMQAGDVLLYDHRTMVMHDLNLTAKPAMEMDISMLPHGHQNFTHMPTILQMVNENAHSPNVPSKRQSFEKNDPIRPITQTKDTDVWRRCWSVSAYGSEPPAIDYYSGSNLREGEQLVPSSDLERYLSAYKRYGFVVVEQVYSHQIVKSLRADLRDSILRHSSTRKSTTAAPSTATAAAVPAAPITTTGGSNTDASATTTTTPTAAKSKSKAKAGAGLDIKRLYKTYTRALYDQVFSAGGVYEGLYLKHMQIVRTDVQLQWVLYNMVNGTYAQNKAPFTSFHPNWRASWKMWARLGRVRITTPHDLLMTGDYQASTRRLWSLREGLRRTHEKNENMVPKHRRPGELRRVTAEWLGCYLPSELPPLHQLLGSSAPLSRAKRPRSNDDATAMTTTTTTTTTDVDDDRSAKRQSKSAGSPGKDEKRHHRKTDSDDHSSSKKLKLKQKHKQKKDQPSRSRSPDHSGDTTESESGSDTDTRRRDHHRSQKPSRVDDRDKQREKKRGRSAEHSKHRSARSMSRSSTESPEPRSKEAKHKSKGSKSSEAKPSKKRQVDVQATKVKYQDRIRNDPSLWALLPELSGCLLGGFGVAHTEPHSVATTTAEKADNVFWLIELWREWHSTLPADQAARYEEPRAISMSQSAEGQYVVSVPEGFQWPDEDEDEKANAPSFNLHNKKQVQYVGPTMKLRKRKLAASILMKKPTDVVLKSGSPTKQVSTKNHGYEAEMSIDSGDDE